MLDYPNISHMEKAACPLIQLSSVTKQYDATYAVKDVSFDVQEGESLGIVGPNGAGKTTLIRMLCALIPVSAGIIEYNGQRISFSDQGKRLYNKRFPNLIAFRQQIGFVPQNTTLDEKLTAWENLELEANLYHLKPGVMVKEISTILELVQLNDRSKTLVREFSGGMKRRLELARALLHHPQILILDEPTIGLDPAAKMQIWRYLQHLQQAEHLTIILSTNNMEEAEFLCDHIAIVDQGRLVIYGTIQELKDHLPMELVSIEVAPQDGEAVNILCTQFSAGEIGDSTFHMTRYSQIKPGFFKCYVDVGEIAVSVISQSLNAQGVNIWSIWHQKATLDDVFVYFTQQSQDIPFDQLDILVKIAQALGLDLGEGNSRVA